MKNESHGLIIKKYWLNKIFSDNPKTWEIRGSRTKRRGNIQLIESGSGNIVGECKLVDCIGPLSDSEIEQNRSKHQIADDFDISYKNVFAWVLNDARRYANPVSYEHPQGAVIWVKLD